MQILFFVKLIGDLELILMIWLPYLAFICQALILIVLTLFHLSSANFWDHADLSSGEEEKG